MRNFTFILGLALAITAGACADDITLQNGMVYKDAKVVSHDATTAQILYRDGGVTVPIEQLSDELQKSLGYEPQKAQPILAQAGELKDFQDAQKKYYLVNGNLAPKEAVTPFVLNFKLLQVTDAFDSSGSKIGHGSYVEIYDPNYVPAVTDPVPVVVTPAAPIDDGTSTNAPPVSPPISGPQDTGRKAFLVNYIAPSDELTTVKGARQGVTAAGDPYYLVVADTFTLDEWRNAGSPK